jgi:cytochrome c553
MLTLASLTACRGGEDGEDRVTPDTTAAAAVESTLAPDTTETAFWAHLQAVDYRSWAEWPGKGELYPGTEPHGMLLTTYVNDLARDALTNGATTMPAGAIIVKENYMPDSTLAAVTAMYKVSGYDSAHNDWYWAKWDPNGVAEVAGRVEMCAACHGANANADYLMTARPAR